jgi:hypothetical protein
LVRSTLAIYITLSAVAVVAVAQILYFKLVIARETARADDASDAMPRADTMQLADALVAWPEIAMEAAELRLAAETTLAAAEARSAAEPVLIAA